MNWLSDRKRAGGPALGDDASGRDWLMLWGDRLVVAGLLVAGVFGLLVAVEFVVLQAIRWPVPLLYVFSAQVGGNLTLVTLVLSINQLVLSRQLSSPGELREEIREVTNYRQAVQNASAGEVAPVTPSDFLARLLENTDDKVEQLYDITTGGENTALDRELDDLATSLDEHMSEVSRLLSRGDVGTFATLSATLHTNYGEQIRRVQSLAAQYGDTFTEDEREVLTELVSRMRQIDVARQYFKTLYMQSELASLSRLLLYVGVPAEVISTVMLLAAAGPQAQSFYSTMPPLVLAATVAVGFGPLAVLFAFVLRIATVAQRTAAITPFTTDEEQYY